MQFLRLTVFTMASVISVAAAQAPAGAAPLVPAEPGTATLTATNAVLRGPRDAAAERALNPFLRFQTNERGDVFLDYQYRSTNSLLSPNQPTIEVHAE